MGIINNKDIIYKNSKTFFWASQFLPKKILSKVINIYSFCRIHDDIVDEGMLINNSQESLQLEEIIKSYGISKVLIDELIDGINSDINFRRYKNNSDLLRYCYKVAGVVGLMMAKALEIDNKEAKYFAIDLGVAMQLTNIARDISQDHFKNRIYLPEDTGVDNDLMNNMTHENMSKIKKSVDNLLIKADIFYNSSINGLRFIPIKSRVSILIALRIYQAIGLKIKKTGTKFLSENIYITGPEKLFLVVKSIIEFFIFFLFPIHRKKHNKYLHESLIGLSDVHK
jgi:phytoene synthase